MWGMDAQVSSEVVWRLVCGITQRTSLRMHTCNTVFRFLHCKIQQACSLTVHSVAHYLAYKYLPALTVLWFIFLSPPAPPAFCPRTHNLVAPFLPQVFIPLTSLLPFTTSASLHTHAHPASAFSVLAHPDTSPVAPLGFRLISLWVEEDKSSLAPWQRSTVAISQPSWTRALLEVLIQRSVSSPSTKPSPRSAVLLHLIISFVVLHALSFALGHLLNAVIVSSNACQRRWGDVFALSLHRAVG